MPHQPLWFSKLSRIEADLQSIPELYIDRHAVERIFGVAERRARELMAGLPGLRIGNAHAIEKAALLEFLKRTSKGVPFRREQIRRKRLVSHLDDARKLHAGRQVRIPASLPQPGILPEGVSLGTGELRVQFHSSEDLAARLYALGTAMATDWEAFQNEILQHITTPS